MLIWLLICAMPTILIVSVVHVMYLRATSRPSLLNWKRTNLQCSTLLCLIRVARRLLFYSLFAELRRLMRAFCTLGRDFFSYPLSFFELRKKTYLYLSAWPVLMIFMRTWEKSQPPPLQDKKKNSWSPYRNGEKINGFKVESWWLWTKQFNRSM